MQGATGVISFEDIVTAWSPEAFQKAQKEDKPIFLSVGYS
ncbi:MAG TPA: DUF255 domain-containing protein [Gelria sp.]|nr:DUF255 domain-containing protein [Gelria sp.]